METLKLKFADQANAIHASSNVNHWMETKFKTIKPRGKFFDGEQTRTKPVNHGKEIKMNFK